MDFNHLQFQLPPNLGYHQYNGLPLPPPPTTSVQSIDRRTNSSTDKLCERPRLVLDLITINIQFRRLVTIAGKQNRMHR